MPNILSNLLINEVSSVDRGAGEGVKIMLLKREDKPMSKIGSLFAKVFGGEQNNNEVIDKSIEGLAESIGTIVKEAGTPEDLSKSLTTTFEQFGDHLKKTLTAGEVVVQKEGSNMDLKVLAKSFGLPETATEAEVSAAIAKQQADMVAVTANVAKMALDLAISKALFSDDELAFYNKAEGADDGTNDDVNKDMTNKKSFRLASKEARAKTMKSAEPPVSAEVQKVMDENAAMKKRLEALESGTNLAAFTKQATDMGLAAEHGVTLQKAYSGDKEAVDKLVELTKAAMSSEATGTAFREFGVSKGAPVADNAMAALNAKAEELRKSKPELSFAQAFSKVYEADTALAARERAENRPQ